MGDRASISFKKGTDESVAFFSHWDGKDLFGRALSFAKQLKYKRGGNGFPLDRFEPNTVMLEFIRRYIKGPVTSNYYLGIDRNDGDNSDNGHKVIDFDKI